MRDPVLAAFIEQLMTKEITPLLPPVRVDLPLYGAMLRARFANPAIADRLSRLCRNGSTKVPTHLLSSIREARAAHRPHELLTLAVSGWCRYLRGFDDEGRDIKLDDPVGARLQALALLGGEDPRPLLNDGATFGSLGTCPDFVAAVQRDLVEIEVRGTRAVIAARTAFDDHLVVR
jgi:fructuronate reductase/mannitol 2-dehydrogenase